MLFPELDAPHPTAFYPTGLLLGLSFFVMAVSGFMLMVAPRGRTAQAIDWHLAGLSRTGWEGVHLATSILFMVFAGWHFWVHLGAYRTLLFGTAVHPGGHRLEALVAVLAIAGLAAAAIIGWPPASWRCHPALS